MEDKFEFPDEPEEDEIGERFAGEIEESEQRAGRREKRKQPSMPMHGAGLRGRPPRPLSKKIRQKIQKTQE